MDPERVRNVAFGPPPMGKRGYNEDQVDAFLDWVEAALRDPGRGGLTVEQIRDVTFSKPPIGKRGYHRDEVDAFLDSVARQVGGPGGSPSEPAPGDRPPTRYTMKIQPNLFLFWTPQWHDWRSDDTSGGSGDGVLDFVLEFLFDLLWNWFLWRVWAAVAWSLEGFVAVALCPISLLTSLLGARRHRLIAVPNDGTDALVLSQGSWYAVRRARAEARDQIAAGDGVLTL
ncbi:DivIVA domain-containing protein [Mycobacterium sp. UM_CSW]|uniref:DivIVA domain-containing protein n=1 Tax=Mycobacterium sp. UM_CSW TaxID=1370119 RepID=UPI0003F5BEB0|nr:DivIVA domain-containing protein [Mycobacterium sp. UM_CSW]